MDTKAFTFVLQNTTVEVEVVVPYELSNQPVEFKTTYRQMWADKSFRNRIHLVELKSGLKGRAVARAMHLRNEYMIDRSQLLVANPYEKFESEGGTWSAIRYAEKIGVPYLKASILEVAERE